MLVRDRNTHRILVIGAGYAGMIAAIRSAGKLRKNANAQVTLISADEYFVERIRLHEQAAGQKLRKQEIRKLLPENVEFIRAYVSDINPEAKTVTTHDGREFDYDSLVYALGSSTNMDLVKGAKQYAVPVEEGTLMDKVAQVAKNGGRVLVIGGGLTGMEISSEIATSYPSAQVTIVTDDRFGSTLSAAGRDYMKSRFVHYGIEIIDETRVIEVQENVVFTKQGKVTFDLCVWTASMKVSPLAHNAGFQTNAAGQIMVDSHLRSLSHPDVYAVGDSAYMPEDHLPTRMSCQLAMPMGAHAADNLVRVVREEATKPFSFAYTLRCISIGRRDGLADMVLPEDQPNGRIFTGRVGAWIKAFIVWWTFFSIKLERWIPGSYFIRPYPKKKKAEREQETVAVR